MHSPYLEVRLAYGARFSNKLYSPDVLLGRCQGMIGRKNRFHGLHSLDPVYRRGETIRGPYCLVRYARNPKRRDFRVAVVVSKKVNKSAVVRNRIRRRVYEVVRGYGLTANLDIIVTVLDEVVATMPADQLQKSLRRQLAKLPNTP